MAVIYLQLLTNSELSNYMTWKVWTVNKVAISYYVVHNFYVSCDCTLKFDYDGGGGWE